MLNVIQTIIEQFVNVLQVIWVTHVIQLLDASKLNVLVTMIVHWRNTVTRKSINVLTHVIT